MTWLNLFLKRHQLKQADRGGNVEYLIGYEGNAFASTGNAEEDLLSITSVHPMRKETVIQLLRKVDVSRGVVKKLIRDGKLTEVGYQGKRFYMRKLPSMAEVPRS